MDDLMINSHPVHMKVFETIIKECDSSISFQDSLTREEEYKFFGLKIIEILSFLSIKYSLKTPLNELNRRFNELILPIFNNSIQAMPGLYELVDTLKENHIPLVLASSAKNNKIEVILQRLGLEEYFRTIVSGEDEIKKGKPAPDIYLEAAKKIDTKPRSCLVIEDAENGVRAAKAAKIKCIGVHNVYLYQKLGIKQDLTKADLQVNSLSDITIEHINSI